jgi:hypothetical protein
MAHGDCRPWTSPVSRVSCLPYAAICTRPTGLCRASPDLPDLASNLCFVRMIRRHRFWMKPRRIGGWVWSLSMLWAGIGAYVSSLYFLSSTQPITNSQEYGQAVGGVDGLPAWLGGAANVIGDSEVPAIAVWLVLATPVLVFGRARFRAWRQGRRLWTGAWIVGLVLLVYIRVCADTLPSTTTCNTVDGCYAVPYYGPALVNWQELAICVAFVAIATVMTTLLSRPEAIAQLRPNEAT